MEILETTQVMRLAWWVPLAAGILITSGIIAVISASNDQCALFMISSILCIAAVGVLIFTPTYIPNEQMSYTIEITDPAQYQILVEKGYSFKRLFENKEIYTIIGDVLK